MTSFLNDVAIFLFFIFKLKLKNYTVAIKPRSNSFFFFAKLDEISIKLNKIHPSTKPLSLKEGGSRTRIQLNNPFHITTI
jgi:hypothetical protein